MNETQPVRLHVRPATRWDWLERARSAIEIVAFLAAGIWALFTFVIDEHRTYQEAGALRGDLTSQRSPAGDCTADYDATFTNIARIPVTITSGVLRVYTLKAVVPEPTKHVRYLIPMEQRDKLLFQVSTDRFNGTYQPGESDQEGFTFFLDHEVTQPGSPPILIDLALWDETGPKKDQVTDGIPSTDEQSRWSDNRWSWLCAPDETDHGEHPLLPKDTKRDATGAKARTDK